MKSIVLMKGQSGYDALGVFVERLSEAFAKSGYAPHIVDMTHQDWMGSFHKAMQTSPEFAFGFNGIGTGIQIDGVEVYDRLNIPFISAMVDHPVYHFGWYGKPFRNLFTAFADRSHIKFAQRFFKLGLTGFLPQGGALAKNVEAAKSFSERTYDLLFIGTCLDFNGIRDEWRAKLHPSMSCIFDETAELMIGNEGKSVDIAFDEVLKLKGLDIPADKLMHILPLLSRVDIYVRNYRRLHYLRKLAELKSGLKILCHTNNPGLIPVSSENFIVRGQIPMEDMFRLLGDVKLVLNIMPGYTEGVHERIFSSMLNGAACLSDRNMMLEQEFEDGRDIIFTSFKELDSLSDKLESAFSDLKRLEELSLAGKLKAEASHSWDSRAALILGFVEELKASGKQN